MIRSTDAFILAYTKLRTRKVRTIVTATIASLLFSLIVIAILVVAGVVNSAEKFTEGELSERYMTTIIDMDSGVSMNSPSLHARANALHKELVAEKTAEAKRLGVEYDPKYEKSPVIDLGGGEQMLDDSSLAAQKAMAEHRQAQPTAIDRAKKLAHPYDPVAVYETSFSAITGKATSMKDGQEVFDYDENVIRGFGDSQVSDGWVYMDKAVTEPFLLDQVQLARQAADNAIPVIVPYNQVEKALKREALPKNASKSQQLERIQEVRRHAGDVTFEICYRNPASVQLIEQAKQVQDEINRNKNNLNYKKPSLVYGLPAANSCGPAVVASDTRSTEEKKYAAKMEEFEYKFNPSARPEQQKVIFRVVGLTPDVPDYGSFSSIDGLVQMVAGSSLQGIWVVPNHLYEQLPDRAAYDKFKLSPGSVASLESMHIMSSVGQLVEFNSADDAKRFIEAESCADWDCASKPHIQYFGSNSALIDEIMDRSRKVIQVAGLIVAAIASIIMMGMVGRVIADSRRETAVFRAIGARRSDVAIVYIIYTVLFAFIIAVIALGLGFALASWINYKWSDEATVSAQLAFIGTKDGEVFRLIDLWPEALMAVAGLVVAASLLSVALPLARNVRRSPLRDMRDDQ